MKEYNSNYFLMFLASAMTAMSLMILEPQAWCSNLPGSFNFEQLRSMGYKELASGDYRNAESALTECVRRRPNDAFSRRYLAYAMIYNGHQNEAVTQYEEWSKLESLKLSDKIAFGKILSSPKIQSAQANASFFFQVLVTDYSSNVDDLIEIAKECCSIGLIYGGPTSRAIDLAKPNASDNQVQELCALLEKINELKKPEMKTHPKGLTPEDMKMFGTPQVSIGQ